MASDVLVNVVMPTSLGVIVFTMGTELTAEDFKMVMRKPAAFLVSLVCHTLVLPGAAFLMIAAMGLSGPLAAGMMLMAVCPTSTLATLLTYLGKGDFALALSTTAVTNLIALVAVPLVTSMSIAFYIEPSAVGSVPTDMIVNQMLLVVGTPVVAGMLARQYAPELVSRSAKFMKAASVLLFAVIVIGAIAKYWKEVVSHAAEVVPVVFSIAVLATATSLAIAKMAGFQLRQGGAIALSSCVQNVALGVVLSLTAIGIQEMAIPSAIYTLAMYSVGIPFSIWMNRSLKMAQ